MKEIVLIVGVMAGEEPGKVVHMALVPMDRLEGMPIDQMNGVEVQDLGKEAEELGDAIESLFLRLGWEKQHGVVADLHQFVLERTRWSSGIVAHQVCVIRWSV